VFTLYIGHGHFFPTLHPPQTYSFILETEALLSSERRSAHLSHGLETQ